VPAWRVAALHGPVPTRKGGIRVIGGDNIVMKKANVKWFWAESNRSRITLEVIVEPTLARAEEQRRARWRRKNLTKGQSLDPGGVSQGDLETDMASFRS